MKITEINKMFIFDQLKFQELLLNKKDTLEWWSEMNNFIKSSRNKDYFPYVFEHKTRVVRTKLGKLKIPVTIFKYGKDKFIHPFYSNLIKNNNEEKYEEAFELFQNGISQKSIATKMFNSAFHQTTLVKRFKKKLKAKQIEIL